MGFLLGVGLVAALFYLASDYRRHGAAHWGSFPSWHPGEGPMPIFAFVVIGILLAAALHLLPLLLIAGLGYVVFRAFTGHGSPLPALNFGQHGPGAAAAPAEQGVFCPSCNQPVSRHWATCPHCGYRKYVAPDLVQRRCATCGTSLQKDWNACPYCSTRIDAPVTVPAPGPAEPPHSPSA